VSPPPFALPSSAIGGRTASNYVGVRNRKLARAKHRAEFWPGHGWELRSGQGHNPDQLVDLCKHHRSTGRYPR
jgi:hypothetical protein